MSAPRRRNVFSKRDLTIAMARSCLLILALGVCLPLTVKADGLALLPAELELRGPEARQQLLLEEVRDGQYVGQVTDQVTFETSDGAVARVENGVVLAVGNGAATITARRGDATATARVTVTAMDQPFAWSFRNHVQSVLTKAGCNSGACHGAAAGKNGFRLSLRAYNPEGDFLSLTRDARGRRIVPGDPGRSLLLTKPTGLVPHRGGVRFAADSLEYRVLAEWIAAATPAPSPSDPRMTHVEVLPAATVLKVGDRQQLVVRGHFSDGRVEDVTRWTKFTANNAAVAQVDDLGLVQVMGHGEASVTVWCQSKVAVATLTAPYETPLDPAQLAALPRRNLIDQRVLEKLTALRVPPAAPATDAEFLRRAFLDTIGTLPTADEARAFLADGAADKRDRLIEALLARPEYVDYWTYKLSDLLLVNSEKLAPEAMWSYHHWIRRHVASNTPWDQMARELLTARGSTLENGAAGFFLLHQDPLDMAETTTVALLGFSINCARCHNHPLEKWTNDQYYGMANLFAHVRTKNLGSDAERAVFDADEGEVIQPLTGKAQPAAPLDAAAQGAAAADSRREHLAAWLTAAENPYFRRAMVNRVWANFFSVGLVEPVDDMRQTNPASNEALLADLAKFFLDQGHDLKQLMRLILQSHTYQRSSLASPENADDRRFYSRYYPRRLMAEVLLDAVSQATGAPTAFADYPSGWRALQLPDANVPSYFLKTFGRPDRTITCECERTAEPSMVQVLHLANGDALNQKLSAAGNRIEELLGGGATDETIVQEAYLGALARFPTADELARLKAVLAETPPNERRAALEDLFWGLLSSKEFLFNH